VKQIKKLDAETVDEKNMRIVFGRKVNRPVYRGI